MRRFPLIGVATCCALLTTPPASCDPADRQPAPPATISTTNGVLRLQSARTVLQLNGQTGALLSLAQTGTKNRAILRGGADLWRLTRHKAAPLHAAMSRDPERMRFTHRWDANAQALHLQYAAEEADVVVTIRPVDTGLEWRTRVTMHAGTLLNWECPAELRFPAAQANTFYFPHRLGVAFTGEFFRGSHGTWQRHMVGPKAFRRVTGDHCTMRPVADDRVALVPGKDANGWLPAWYRKEMATWRTMVNRSPAGGKHDACIVSSEHGPWLTGYQLGGKGWYFVLGGFLAEEDYRPRFASIAATLSRVLRGDATTATRRIAVLGATGDARPGGRTTELARLVGDLRKLPNMRDGKIRVEAVRTLEDLRAVLHDPAAWPVVINPMHERFLCAAAGEHEQALDEIAAYVRAGGTWWEAGGGYPLYGALAPSDETTWTVQASKLFCDWVHLDSTAGNVALFGIQKPDALFTCPEITFGARHGADGHGRFTHRYLAHVAPGQAWQVPTMRMAVGAGMRETLRAYAEANDIGRPLSSKIDPKTLATLKRSVLFKLQGMSLRDQVRTARELPAPLLIHNANYLLGGFDKQYPDHLPPNPAVGTAEDLAELIRVCRERGHLYMPYTNPTWWCTEPKGPTFLREGNAPLARGLDGELLPESYGGHAARGFTTCLFHPAVRRANDVILEQFTKHYPVDILFQDQVGARSLRYDTNPAAPHPAAYLQGLYAIAAHDAKVVPLATEDGHDRIINDETMFCGLSWPWLPNRPGVRMLYTDIWPESAVRVEPIAAYLAHAHVLFRHHDLAGFIRDRYDLVTSLSFGYGLSYVVTRYPGDDPGVLRWLDCLTRVQGSVGRRLAGRPLDSFAYETRRVTRSRWGDLTLVTNLGETPYVLDEQTTIAPEGFFATSPGLTAGVFTRFEGITRDPRGWWLIHDGETPEWTFVGDRR